MYGDYEASSRSSLFGGWYGEEHHRPATLLGRIVFAEVFLVPCRHATMVQRRSRRLREVAHDWSQDHRVKRLSSGRPSV